ncbi:MAG: gamma-glutamylcyclotransferase [Sphingopyxis sp.]|jgi:gamma-glutamylcyclotransferase (GGCT)/AIG2-like uncharacterized protein YtfP|nr:gamma-glutamylcyclotransferase [Sphingopyxis sp.]
MSADGADPARLIAVYGSLRPGGEGYRRFQLDTKTRHVGACVLRGLLDMRGGYPALLPGDHRVEGDLLEVRDTAMLDAIDAWEGAGYRRIKTMLVEPAIHAWVWHWAGDDAAEHQAGTADDAAMDTPGVLGDLVDLWDGVQIVRTVFSVARAIIE